MNASVQSKPGYLVQSFSPEIFLATFDSMPSIPDDGNIEMEVLGGFATYWRNWVRQWIEVSITNTIPALIKLNHSNTCAASVYSVKSIGFVCELVSICSKPCLALFNVYIWMLHPIHVGGRRASVQVLQKLLWLQSAEHRDGAFTSSPLYLELTLVALCLAWYLELFNFDAQS